MDDSCLAPGPLAGRRVVTTRGAPADDRLAALLAGAGARVLSWPTCEYPPPRDPAPLQAALARLDRFDWVVLTSARAVAAVGAAAAAAVDAPAGPGGSTRPRVRPPSPRVAAVGPATARAAAGAGWRVAVEGRGPGSSGLAAQVAATCPLAGARVLFPAASGAAPTMEEEFTALGARVVRVEAYRTVVTPPPAARVRADLAAGVDAVTFASPSAVEAVDRALDGEIARSLAGVVVVCIGPTTGAELARRGLGGARMAATATLEGMLDALAAGFGEAAGAGSSTRVAGGSGKAADRSRASAGGSPRVAAARQQGRRP